MLVWPATLEGDNPLGIVDCDGECFLLSCVQLPCFFNLKEKKYVEKCSLRLKIMNSSQRVERHFVPERLFVNMNSLKAVPIKEEYNDR